MTTYLAIRDGQVKMPLSNPTIKADGSIWMHGNPLLDSESEGARKIGMDKLRELARANKWSEIPADAYAKIGTMPSGLIVIDQQEYLRQQRENRTPAQKERDRINGLYAKADRVANSNSEDNVWLPMQLRGQADKALAKWREDYPEEAKAERKAALMADAAELRSKAVGALTYDADGWLDNAAQQARHDEYISKAEAIEAQANNL